MGGCRLGLAARIQRSKPRPSWLTIDFCRSATDGQSAASRWPMSSTKTDGASLMGICSDLKRLVDCPKRPPDQRSSRPATRLPKPRKDVHILALW